MINILCQSPQTRLKNDTLSLKTFFEKQGLANTTTARNGVFRQAVRVSPQAQFYNRNLNNAASFFTK